MKALSVARSLPLNGRTFDFSDQGRMLADLTARAAIIVLFSFMALRIGTDFLVTGRITGLFLLFSETLVVVLTVVRRPAATVDRSLRARILTAVSTLGPPLLAPGAVAMAPESLTVALPERGEYTVRVRWSQFLTPSEGCMRQAPGGWSTLVVDRPATVKIDDSLLARHC